MKQFQLPVENREAQGRGAVRRLRTTGRIPAVVYGPNAPRNVSIGERDFLALWKKVQGVTAFIQLEGVETEAIFTIIKDVQRDALSDQFMHVDFHEIERGKPMTAGVAVHVVGEAEGVRNEGGLLETHAHELTVRCRPRHLPEFVEVDVTELHNGHSFHIRDLVEIEGVEFLDNPDDVIVACVGPGGGASDDEGEGDGEEADDEAEA